MSVTDSYSASAVTLLPMFPSVWSSYYYDPLLEPIIVSTIVSDLLSLFHCDQLYPIPRSLDFQLCRVSRVMRGSVERRQFRLDRGSVVGTIPQSRYPADMLFVLVLNRP